MDRRTALEVLGLGEEEARDPVVLKRAYRRALLSSHPDKRATNHSVSVDVVRSSFLLLSSNGGGRERGPKQAGWTEVDLDDFELREGRYVLACRCGHAHSLTEADLARGDNLVPCDGCSLVVKVLYEEVDADDDGSVDDDSDEDGQTGERKEDKNN